MNGDHCRTCGAEIFWAKTVKGKVMPVNAQPDPNGNIVKGEPGQVVVFRDAASIAPRFEGQDRYLAHFVTCPHADQHRRPR